MQFSSRCQSLLILIFIALTQNSFANGISGYLPWPQKHAGKEQKLEKADRIVIYKSKRILQLYKEDRLLNQFYVALGQNPIGHKQFEGDGRTPEGEYRIISKNSESGYYLSLQISYPNEKDREYARRMGKSPGGDIMIHGIKNGFGWVGYFHSYFDWTRGCIAVSNGEIEEVWARVEIGTRVQIEK